MADDPPEQLTQQFELISRKAGGALTVDDAERLEEFGQAIFEGIPYPQYETEDGTNAYSAATVRQYLIRLRIDVAETDRELSSIDAETFNSLMADLDGDRARSTTTQTQSAAKHFFRYFDDLGVDPEDIAVFKEDQTQKQVDPEELLTSDEIEDIREVIDGTVNPIRNRAFLEMLIYTGQRLRALQTLKLKDVHPEEPPGHILLNEDADGLKGATERGRRRPLLASRKFVREWKERHPYRDDPDAWFFVGQPSHSNTSKDNPWSSTAMRRTLKRAAKQAGIENYNERVTPHAFRHFWYTSMRRQENADPEDLKAVGGWAEGSNTPEQVYKNFEDREHGERLERDLGYRESEDGERFIPELCPTCGEPLESHWKQCPNCGEQFVDDQLREAEADTVQSKHEAEGADQLNWEAMQKLMMEHSDEFEEILNQTDE